MANTLSFVTTSMQKSTPSTLGEFPVVFSKEIYADVDCFFSVKLSYLNFKRLELGLNQITSSFVLTAYLCSTVTDTSFTVIRSKSYSYSSIQNEFIKINITDLLDSQQDLYDQMTFDEVLSLCKEYKIVFRITSDVITEDQHYPIDGDIINDLKLVLNTETQGPYEVQYRFYDLVDPEKMTEQQVLNSYENVRSLFGYEGLVVFYALNCVNMPLVVIQHGLSHESVGYISYASLLASYGYCVLVVQQESFASNTLGEGQYHLIGKLQHFKDNIDIITDFELTSKIDFSKIALMGHSQGSSKVYSALKQLPISTSSSIGINDFFSFCLMGPVPLGSSLGWDGSNPPSETYFHFVTDIPVLILGANHDSASLGKVHHNYFNNYGINASGRNSVKKMMIVGKNKGHGSFVSDYENMDIDNALFFRDVNNFNIFSSNIEHVSYYASKTVQFFSYVIKNKINKILNITCDLSDFSSRKNTINSCFDSYLHQNISSTRRYIDEFNSLNPNLSHNVSNFVFTYPGARDDQSSLNYSDPFDGVLNRYGNYGSGSGGITFTFNSDSKIQYLVNLNLFPSSDIQIYTCQIKPSPAHSENNNLDFVHFCLELEDSFGNISTVSSKNLNKGVPPFEYRRIFTVDPMVSPYPIVFRVQDFVQQNKDLQIGNITKMTIRFGPSYGTSSARLSIHKIITTI